MNVGFLWVRRIRRTRHRKESRLLPPPKKYIKMDDNLFLEEKVVWIYIFSFLDRRSSSSSSSFFFFSLPIAPFIPRGKSEFLTKKKYFSYLVFCFWLCVACYARQIFLLFSLLALYCSSLFFLYFWKLARRVVRARCVRGDCRSIWAPLIESNEGKRSGSRQCAAISQQENESQRHTVNSRTHTVGTQKAALKPKSHHILLLLLFIPILSKKERELSRKRERTRDCQKVDVPGLLFSTRQPQRFSSSKDWTPL